MVLRTTPICSPELTIREFHLMCTIRPAPHGRDGRVIHSPPAAFERGRRSCPGRFCLSNTWMIAMMTV
jgi:hypothetical protein